MITITKVGPGGPSVRVCGGQALSVPGAGGAAAGGEGARVGTKPTQVSPVSLSGAGHTSDSSGRHRRTTSRVGLSEYQVDSRYMICAAKVTLEM